MPNKEEADKAIAELNGKDLRGRTMTVNEARPRTDRPRTGGRFGLYSWNLLNGTMSAAPAVAAGTDRTRGHVLFVHVP